MAALRSFEILDTERDAAFDDLTRVASKVCGVPIALVSLVDDDRQWFKSRQGLDATETSREVAFCAHAIHQKGAMVVNDSHLDARFADNPLVRGAPNVRFYAGAPLQSGAGTAVGTLCVIDHKPRQLSPDQLEMLESLASHVVSLMELRRTSRRLAAATRRALELERMVMTYTQRSVWERLAFAEQGAFPGLVGERTDRADLFTDICSFTRLSGELPPEQVSAFLNRYLGMATDHVHACGGDVEKFIGDCVFSVFSSADEALQAATRIHEGAARAASEDRARGLPGLSLRTGVHWGEALRTHVGNAERRDNTLIGEAVNVAARLQQAAKPGEILASAEILEEASGEVRLGERRVLQLKGLAGDVTARVVLVPSR